METSKFEMLTHKRLNWGRPERRYQWIFAHKYLPNMFCSTDPNQWVTQDVSFEDFSIFLPLLFEEFCSLSNTLEITKLIVIEKNQFVTKVLRKFKWCTPVHYALLHKIFDYQHHKNVYFGSYYNCRISGKVFQM